jgi:hypothetical protein
MNMEVVFTTKEKVAFGIIAAAFIFAFIGTTLNQKLVNDVKRRAPSKATGLRNLYETNDNGRVWREHRQLFPKSRVRTRARAFLTLAGVTMLAGFFLLLFSGR